MMVGLPASGKSTFAESLVLTESNNNSKYVVHSSDKLREELYGNASIQGDNNKLFSELHRRIKDDLRKGISAIKTVLLWLLNIELVSIAMNIGSEKCHPKLYKECI